jgi:hypothetical protein
LPIIESCVAYDIWMFLVLLGGSELQILKNGIVVWILMNLHSCASVDVWVKLHARMLALIHGLNRSVEACKKKFNTLFK